jgi:hypothetical protein
MFIPFEFCLQADPEIVPGSAEYDLLVVVLIDIRRPPPSRDRTAQRMRVCSGFA